MKKIVVTGGAGQIAYSLLFRIAQGDLFGGAEKIDLRICDLPDKKATLEGVAMELIDCAYPLLDKLTIGTDLRSLSEGVDLALLIGARPRSKGMERIDLLQENGKIFVEAGRALNEVAHEKVKVLVVGNPCNTNCLIALHHAPRLSPYNFHALTRLDQNRATALLAERTHSPVSSVKKMTIWGNHSGSQVPDYKNVMINDHPATEKLPLSWLQQEFMANVQQRGSEVLRKRGSSSAASAAQGIVDAVNAIYLPTERGNWYSSAVYSKGNPYGIDEDLVFGFPLQTDQKGEYKIVEGLEWDYFIKEKIALTQNELLEERALVNDLFLKT